MYKKKKVFSSFYRTLLGDKGLTALIRASYNRHWNTIHILLQNNADIDAKDNEGNSALIWATLEQGWTEGRSNQPKAEGF